MRTDTDYETPPVSGRDCFLVALEKIMLLLEAAKPCDRRSLPVFYMLNYRRAERLPWARPTMESPERTEIKVFDYDHGTRDIGVRRYIWLAEYDYVLILQRKKKALFWVTAYYVDSEGGRNDLSRRYEKRL